LSRIKRGGVEFRNNETKTDLHKISKSLVNEQLERQTAAASVGNVN
jgi:hypothetical protein